MVQRILAGVPALGHSRRGRRACWKIERRGQRYRPLGRLGSSQHLGNARYAMVVEEHAGRCAERVDALSAQVRVFLPARVRAARFVRFPRARGLAARRRIETGVVGIALVVVLVKAGVDHGRAFRLHRHRIASVRRDGDKVDVRPGDDDRLPSGSRGKAPRSGGGGGATSTFHGGGIQSLQSFGGADVVAGPVSDTA